MFLLVRHLLIYIIIFFICLFCYCHRYFFVRDGIFYQELDQNTRDCFDFVDWYFSILFYLSGKELWIFDFMGHYIPNVFSEVTGGREQGFFLVQRLYIFWLV